MPFVYTVRQVENDIMSKTLGLDLSKAKTAETKQRAKVDALAAYERQRWLAEMEICTRLCMDDDAAVQAAVPPPPVPPPVPLSPAKVLIPAQALAAPVHAAVPPMLVSATPAQACVHCEAPSETIKPCSLCPTRRMVCANCTTRQFEYDGVLWLCHEHAPPPLPAPAPAAPAPPPVPPTPPAMALTPTPLWLSCQGPPPVPPAANAELDDDLVIPIPDSIVRRSRRKRHLPSHMGGGCRKK